MVFAEAMNISVAVLDNSVVLGIIRVQEFINMC